MDEADEPEVPSINWREARGVLVLSACAALVVIVASFVALGTPETPLAASASDPGVASVIKLPATPFEPGSPGHQHAPIAAHGKVPRP